MKYFGLKSESVPTGHNLISAFRDLSFLLNDPGTWNTHDFLELLWRKAGGIIDSVTLRSTYRNPDTHTISHLYRIVFNVAQNNSHAGLAFPVSKLNKLVGEIEDEMSEKLSITFKSHHTA